MICRCAWSKIITSRQLWGEINQLRIFSNQIYWVDLVSASSCLNQHTLSRSKAVIWRCAWNKMTINGQLQMGHNLTYAAGVPHSEFTHSSSFLSSLSFSSTLHLITQIASVSKRLPPTNAMLKFLDGVRQNNTVPLNSRWRSVDTDYHVLKRLCCIII